MMETTKIDEFLSRVRALGIKLWLDGESLRYRAPEGALTSDLRGRLKERKAEIIAFLRQSGPRTIGRTPEREDYELSHAQRRLWVLSRLEDGSIAYNIPMRLWLDGPLDRAALEGAFAEMVRRHESLRTVFSVVDGEPRQKVNEEVGFHIRFMEIPDDGQAEKMVMELAREDATRPFDLEKGPLLRATLIQQGPDRHALFFTLHHIVADGWSISIMMRELSHLYESLKKGKNRPLPPLRIHYKDYALWQNGLLERDAAVHRDYWLEKLSGELPTLNLATDFPRPPIQTFNGRLFPFSLDAGRMEGLLSLARRNNASLFMVLATMVKVLLYRYTDQEEIIIGTPIAGRDHQDLEDQVGFYLNLLALRDRVRADASFEEFLRQSRQTAIDAYDHQIYPFDKLVDELDLPRDLSRPPLFSVMVLLQNVGDLDLSLPDLQTSIIPQEYAASKFDISFDFKELGSDLGACINYNADLFLESRIKAMAGHFITLADGILRDPSESIGRINILTEPEKKMVLTDLNNTRTEYPGDKTVINLFEEQVEKSPDAIAAVFEGRELTYRELDRRASLLARRLKAMGLEPGSLAGVYMDRSLDMLAALLGILKSGGAYVPLDPAYPKGRLAFMLEDAGITVLATQEKMVPGFLEILESRGACRVPELVCLDDGSDESIPIEGEVETSRAKPDGLAYVIYTSGSTGKPKGVRVSHRNLVNFLCSMARDPGLTSKDVLLAVTTLSFDIAGLELFLPLTSGAMVIMASRETASDGSRLLRDIKKYGVTAMQATPATWRLMLASGWTGRLGIKALCGGEALPRELAVQLLEKCDFVYNMYGPTETTIWSSVRSVERKQKERGGTEGVETLGGPIANTQFYILDRRLQPVPLGTPGELFIGGDGVAGGYFKRPELTAEKFIPDPFAGAMEAEHGRAGSAERPLLYRTGDLVRHLPGGEIEFLGRMDSQVKIRGFRIELGEIESALAGHGSVKQAAAVVREEGRDGKAIVAYVVVETGEMKLETSNSKPGTGDTGLGATVSQTDALISDLRNYLREKLPDYMVPSLLVALESLPLTPNGKVDRKALPDPERSRAGLGRVYEAPRNDLERTLAAVWEDVLRIEKPGIHDDFFDLGGHSLKATKAAFRIQRDLGIDIDLIDIFRRPTISGLAETVGAGERKQLAEIRPLVPEFRETPSAGPGEIATATAEELEILNEE